MYNYLEAMQEDIREYIAENYTTEEAAEKLVELATRDEWEQELHDALWICDSVTGNASGSYTFNSYKAREYVLDNDEILREALQEFCEEADTIAEKFLDGEWEWMDVTIRCYLLGQAIREALDELESELEEKIEEVEHNKEEFNDRFNAFCSQYRACEGCPFANLLTVGDCMEAYAQREEKEAAQ